MKGRDIYGLLTVVPGVQDTTLSRDFSTWTSMGGHHDQRHAEHVQERRRRRRERR